MRSDILCLKDTGGRPTASAGPAQPFNWNRKRTFFWHKSPYVGFVAIRLSRKAVEPDKKGLGEMYWWDIMWSVTQRRVDELVKGWPGVDWSDSRTGQWLMEWSKAVLNTQFHNKSREHTVNTSPHWVQYSPFTRSPTGRLPNMKPPSGTAHSWTNMAARSEKGKSVCLIKTGSNRLSDLLLMVLQTVKNHYCFTSKTRFTSLIPLKNEC